MVESCGRSLTSFKFIPSEDPEFTDSTGTRGNIGKNRYPETHSYFLFLFLSADHGVVAFLLG